MEGKERGKEGRRKERKKDSREHREKRRGPKRVLWAKCQSREFVTKRQRQQPCAPRLSAGGRVQGDGEEGVTVGAPGVKGRGEEEET